MAADIARKLPGCTIETSGGWDTPMVWVIAHQGRTHEMRDGNVAAVVKALRA